MSALHSHGRGGAGNMADSSKSPKIAPADLQTPTIKENTYTTGRGGSGNMAKNTDPTQARLRQDVEPVPRRLSNNVTPIGRGGAANFAKSDIPENAIEDSPATGTSPKRSAEHNRTNSGSLAAKAAQIKQALLGRK